MSDIAKLDQELNEMILSGKALEGCQDATRPRGIAGFESLSELHGAEVRSTGAGDGVTFSEWLLDVTFKIGPRKRLEQTAVRRWEDGKIVHERFYYNA
jgi:hypothetical protein